ncbi:hypothetical protein [Corynebacterium nasicanis]|uniref:Secreted protein n=1 Tax=Corynebacterium nasicanis TaxID=1448267 RepID=A0ABW1Q9F6_9CORY
MIRRRLAIALVAATSLTAALVTPAQAEDTEGAALSATSSLSSTDETIEGVPGWAQSSVIDEETQLYFEIIGAILKVGFVATQGAAIILPHVPGGTDQLRAFLAQWGIRY